jgi:WD40 repeat protein
MSANFFHLLRLREEKGQQCDRKIIDQKFRGIKDRPNNGLYSMELRAHFGCVNALVFAQNQSKGVLLASGGDDQRILIWNVSKAISEPLKASKTMQATHESNVFCLDFDCNTEKIVSGGNDEKVLLHDLETGKNAVILKLKMR